MDETPWPSGVVSVVLGLVAGSRAECAVLDFRRVYVLLYVILW